LEERKQLALAMRAVNAAMGTAKAKGIVAKLLGR
jgi:hypothetical protein